MNLLATWNLGNMNPNRTNFLVYVFGLMMQISSPLVKIVDSKFSKCRQEKKRGVSLLLLDPS